MIAILHILLQYYISTIAFSYNIMIKLFSIHIYYNILILYLYIFCNIYNN